MRHPSARRVTPDEGFTLIELTVSVAIMSVLMAIISTFAVGGMKNIRTLTTLSNVQAQEQDAGEWLSRLLRFTDNPVESLPVTPAVTYAGSTAGAPVLTFHTYAGTGPTDRVPYKVTLTRSAKGVQTTVWTPDMTSGTPVYTGTGHERVLIPVQPGNSPTLRLRYWGGTAAAPVELVPPANGTLTTAQMNSLRAVQFTLSGSGSDMIVDRTVVLQNPRS